MIDDRDWWTPRFLEPGEMTKMQCMGRPENKSADFAHGVRWKFNEDGSGYAYCIACGLTEHFPKKVAEVH